jgi:hypothetical protein
VEFLAVEEGKLREAAEKYKNGIVAVSGIPQTTLGTVQDSGMRGMCLIHVLDKCKSKNMKISSALR